MKNLFLIDGASGTGKSDLVNYVESYNSNINTVSIVKKYTTRQERDYEKQNRRKLDLIFVSPQKFNQLKPYYRYSYDGMDYGFIRSDIDDCLSKNSNVFIIVRNTDLINQLKQDYNFINVVSVYIYTDIEKIRERLIMQTNKEDIDWRLTRIGDVFIKSYLDHARLYDEVLINNSSISDFYKLIQQMLNKYSTLPEVNENLIFIPMIVNKKNKYYHKAVKESALEYDKSLECKNLSDIQEENPSSVPLDLIVKYVNISRMTIIDLTENKENGFYALGYLHGKKYPKNQIITSKTGKHNYNIPNSPEFKIVNYQSDYDLKEKLYKLYEKIIEKKQFRKEIISKRKSNFIIKSNEKTNIIFLSSNPINTTRLHLDGEWRDIRKVIMEGAFSDNFYIDYYPAIRIQDLQDIFIKNEPDIIHFSGHGSESSEIIIENINGQKHAVPIDALTQLFLLYKGKIKCVILNSCYSEIQGKAISEHIDFVIGITKQISDDSAKLFSIGFYKALANGDDIRSAFDKGKLEVQLHSADEHELPVLLSK